jgi:hypothetical protein
MSLLSLKALEIVEVDKFKASANFLILILSIFGH